MKHNDEYLVRLSNDWNYLDDDTEKGKYDGSGYYRMIHAESFDEAIEKWNENDCPRDLKRVWGECGINESLVMVINRKGYVKYYM